LMAKFNTGFSPVYTDFLQSPKGGVTHTITDLTYTDKPRETRHLTTGAVAFDDADPGYARPAAKEIAIANSGNAGAFISAASLSDANAFELVQGNGTVLPGAANTSWKLQPKAGLPGGTYTAAVTFTYNGGKTVSTAVTFTVNSSPAITTAMLPDGVAGTAYSQTLAATGGGGIGWSLDGGALPAGLTLSAAGVLSGTPAAAGVYVFSVKAANNVGSDTKTLSLTVGAAQVSAEILADWIGDSPYTVTRSGGSSANVNIFDWHEVSLVAGDGNLLRAGLDRSRIFLEIDFSFVIKNSGGSDIGENAYNAYDATRRINPYFNLRDRTGGGDERRYSLEFRATAPFVYGANTLRMPMADILNAPAWTTANPPKVPVLLNGDLTEDFGVSTNSGGSRAIEWDKLVAARFHLPNLSAPAFAGHTFEITVSAFRVVYMGEDLPPPEPPEITTTALPDGRVGTPYSHPLAAVGHTPISWEITGGALPPGLTLSESGLIAGTPTTAGTYPFTVKAASSAGGDIKQLSITVAPGTAEPTGKYGDINGDDKVDITDARLLLQHLVGKYTIPEGRLVYARVSGGDTVSINDARLILQFIVEKIDRFPAES
ncbi:MAG: putative Ig domain-containing protein, partial [Oscillospiraceae bacterium]|nr:putative Ig domain-containing protein [Oscillospiraceae bacterium]